MRWFTSVLSFCLIACSDGGGLGEGEVCSASTECAAGLLCDFGQSPPRCASQGTPVPDAPVDPVDAPVDVIDAPPGTPDAPPTPDAPAPDAPLPDAPAPDAPVPDAAPVDGA